MQGHSPAGATPARQARQRTPLLFMFMHPAGVWMRACGVFGKYGDMLVAATFRTGRATVVGGAQ